jgi:outer membrane PBP1 activator LpoA protein
MRTIFLLILIVASCSQLEKSKTTDEFEITPPTKIKLDQARELIKTNKPKLAIQKLSELNDANLSPAEKALKYNLKGVTLFNMQEIDKAILNFEVSEKYAPQKTQLFSQIQLNMASAHFKLNQLSELKERLSNIDEDQLSKDEANKYSQLYFTYALKVQNHPMIVLHALKILSGSKNLSEVTNSSIYENLKSSFYHLNQAKKIELLDEFNNSKNLGCAQLALIEAERLYLEGDKSSARDVVSWLRSEYAGVEEIDKFIKDFNFRLENSGLISTNSIGLVLPLTGEKSSFGQKALAGIDTGLKVLGLNENLKIYTKDTIDSVAQAAQSVVELIREKKVAFIIGGLFPESAKAEYLEARKYGVLYISLSQINLPKEEKNHHLIEVQGSIESQVESLLSDDMIKRFGKRLGVVFPDNEAGKAYIDEIWRKSKLKNLDITSVASFQKNTHDFRDTAQLFLGLKYPRERSEEFKILDDVYAHEKTTIRRVQTLPPVLDFDWVFLATYPHEATQLIPTLAYYDANRIKVVGGPSWVSKSLVKEQKNLGTLYFVGDDPRDINQEILVKFQEIYAKTPGLIEILALDAMKIGADALATSGDVTSRDDFDSKIKSKGKILGLSTEWALSEGVWLKKMNSLTITRGEIVKMFGDEVPQ